MLYIQPILGGGDSEPHCHVGPHHHVHQHLLLIARHFLHQDDRPLAHFQSYPSILWGSSSHIQGKKNIKMCLHGFDFFLGFVARWRKGPAWRKEQYKKNKAAWSSWSHGSCHHSKDCFELCSNLLDYWPCKVQQPLYEFGLILIFLNQLNNNTTQPQPQQ